MSFQLQQYQRYNKKYQHHIMLIKIVIAFLIIMLILKTFGVLMTLGAISAFLVKVTAIITVLIPFYIIPIWLFLHHSRKKYLKKVQSIAEQHHVSQYMQLILTDSKKGM